MTLLELLEECGEAIDFQVACGLDPEEAGLRITRPGLAPEGPVEVLPGVYGENLGHVPTGPEFGHGAALNGTDVFILVRDIRRYVEGLL
jgi:hypothetical protein